jgi:hypothetical protein
VLDQRPAEIMERMLRSQLRSIFEFELMAFRYAESNPSACLGAKKGAAEARRELQRQLTQLGTFPSNQSMWVTVREVSSLIDELLVRMERLDDLCHGFTRCRRRVSGWGDRVAG